jgi:hypothetical protein
MPRVGFESTIPVFERAKTVHALGRTATVIGIICTYWNQKVVIPLCGQCSKVQIRAEPWYECKMQDTEVWSFAN